MNIHKTGIHPSLYNCSMFYSEWEYVEIYIRISSVGYCNFGKGPDWRAGFLKMFLFFLKNSSSWFLRIDYRKSWSFSLLYIIKESSKYYDQFKSLNISKEYYRNNQKLVRFLVPELASWRVMIDFYCAEHVYIKFYLSIFRKIFIKKKVLMLDCF